MTGQVGRHVPELACRDTVSKDAGKLAGEPLVGRSDPALGIGTEPRQIAMEAQAKDWIGGHELNHRHHQCRQLVCGGKVGRDVVHEPVEDGRQHLLDQARQHIFLRCEVVVERGATNAGMVGDIAQSGFNEAEAPEQIESAVQQRLPGFTTVDVERRGVDARHQTILSRWRFFRLPVGKCRR